MEGIEVPVHLWDCLTKPNSHTMQSPRWCPAHALGSNNIKKNQQTNQTNLYRGGKHGNSFIWRLAQGFTPFSFQFHNESGSGNLLL